jgi:hypothetical protein
VKRESPVRERVVDGGGGSELRSRYLGGLKPVVKKDYIIIKKKVFLKTNF